MSVEDLLFNGEAAAKVGRWRDAEAAYRLAMTRDSGDGAALLGLGLALKAQNRNAEALEAFTKATATPAKPVEAFIEAAVACALLARPDDSRRWILKSLGAHPARYEPHFFAGSLLANEGRHAEAIEHLHQALVIKPRNIETIKALIFSLRREGRPHDAETRARAWAAAFPQDAEAAASLAHILREANRLEDALGQARRAMLLAPQSSDWVMLAASILVLLNRADEAERELMRARAKEPGNPEIYLQLGRALKVAGRFDSARAALARAAQLAPGNATMFFELAEITRFAPGDPAIAAMEALAAQPGPVPPKLHFALGKAYDDTGDAARAFSHFASGKIGDAKQARYDEAGTLAIFAQMQALFTPALIESLRGHGNASELPVFIVGLPRSGSTLVEQILASHPDVAGAGEIPLLPQVVERALGFAASGRGSLKTPTPDALRKIADGYLAGLAPFSDGRVRVTDKMLLNALLVGIIQLALPGARIIHCVRNPMDTGLSCFMQSFGPRMGFTTGLDEMGRYMRAHSRLMGHWNAVLPPGAILDVAYEDVVADLEGQARRLVEYCGLPWDAACVAFHKNGRPVNTASAAQVRQPLYTRARGRWQRYARQLAPLRAALGDLILEDGAS